MTFYWYLLRESFGVVLYLLYSTSIPNLHSRDSDDEVRSDSSNWAGRLIAPISQFDQIPTEWIGCCS